VTVVSRVRRLPIRYALAVLVAADLAFLFSRNAQWRGEWLWTIDWVAGGIYLVGPLAAGLVAWNVRFQDRLLADAGALPGFGRRTTWTVLGSASAAILLAHLATVLLAGVVTLTASGGPPPPATWHVVAQFLVLMGYCAVGFLAGTLLRHPLTPPATVAVLFVALILMRQGPLAGVVDFGGATASLAGLAPRWSFDVSHSAIGLGLFAMAAGVGFSATSWRRGQRVDRTGLSLVGLGAAMSLAGAAFLVTAPGEAFVAGSSSVRCQSTSTTELCLVADSEYARGDLSDAVDDINSSLTTLGVAPAAALVQVVPGAPLPPELTLRARPLVVNPGTVGQGRAETLTMLIPYAVIDRRCLAESIDTADLDPLEAASNYLLWLLTQDAEIAARADVRRLQDLYDSARLEWLSAVLNAAGSCSLDELPALPGEG
jgi:hypothetical protein